VATVSDSGGRFPIDRQAFDAVPERGRGTAATWLTTPPFDESSASLKVGESASTKLLEPTDAGNTLHGPDYATSSNTPAGGRRTSGA
jgi:hypothetical protein